MSPEYAIRSMTPAEIGLAIDWAAAEGWNPGLSDAAPFAAVDPEGFIGGFLGDRMIASISIVNYDSAFAFLGFYIVAPDYRGQGYGYRLWQEAVKHAGARTIGLDGVLAEQDSYRKSGFALACRNIRHGGVIALEARRSLPAASPGVAITPLKAADAELEAFDRACFPAPRAPFLQQWMAAPDHVARAARTAEGQLAGYGVIRPCRTGWKIGPLFTDNPATAAVLLESLLTGADVGATDEVFLDTPEPNAPAIALAEMLGLTPVFETARMYKGAAPDIALNRIFGVTTFELG